MVPFSSDRWVYDRLRGRPKDDQADWMGKMKHTPDSERPIVNALIQLPAPPSPHCVNNPVPLKVNLKKFQPRRILKERPSGTTEMNTTPVSCVSRTPNYWRSLKDAQDPRRHHADLLYIERVQGRRLREFNRSEREMRELSQMFAQLQQREEAMKKEKISGEQHRHYEPQIPNPPLSSVNPVSKVRDDKAILVSGDCIYILNCISGQVQLVVGPCCITLEGMKVIEGPRKVTPDEVPFPSEITLPPPEESFDSITGSSLFNNDDEVVTLTAQQVADLLGSSDIRECVIPEGAFPWETNYVEEPPPPTNHTIPTVDTTLDEETQLCELVAMGLLPFPCKHKLIP
ncbi:hypothetical protein Pelo_5822 [Pelomyxa schiedti]|nr:hypothetical protein Pelo_5822 [Pelomyxa schiedti]